MRLIKFVAVPVLVLGLFVLVANICKGSFTTTNKVTADGAEIVTNAVQTQPLVGSNDNSVEIEFSVRLHLADENTPTNNQ